MTREDILRHRQELAIQLHKEAKERGEYLPLFQLYTVSGTLVFESPLAVEAAEYLMSKPGVSIVCILRQGTRETSCNNLIKALVGYLERGEYDNV